MDTIESDIKVSTMNPTDDLLDESSNSYANRASFREAAGQYEQAIADHKQSLAIDPKRGDAFFFMGICYQKIGGKEEAVAAFTTAASLYEEQGSRQAGAARRWVNKLQTGN
jgi:tetratricopeptide (TPR) repeat protein